MRKVFKTIVRENRNEFQVQHYNRTKQNVIARRPPIRLKIREIKNIRAIIKIGKAAGQGNIPGELLKYETPKVYSQLKERFQECINRADVPEQ